MRVAVNMVGIRPGYGGRQEVFLRNIVKQIATMKKSVDIVVLVDGENCDTFPDLETATPESGDRVGETASAQGADVVFSPLNTAPTKSPIPLVVCAMELYALARNGKTKRFFAPSPLKAAAEICAKAAAVVAPSQFMRSELLNLLDIPLDKVVVAHPGVEPLFANDHSSIVETPYLLAVGNTREQKNIPRLMSAFEKIARDFPHTLVIVGQPFESELDDWGPRVVRIDRLPAEHLAGLYQNCGLYICPSTYDGCGITVLEALKAGACVATGRIGGIPEISGDVPIFFNPESVDSIVGAIRRGLQEDSHKRQERAHFGQQVAAEYTWEKCARQTLNAFRRGDR